MWIANWTCLLGAVTSFRAYDITGPHINMWILKKSPGLDDIIYSFDKAVYFLSSHKCYFVVNQGNQTWQTPAPIGRLWHTYDNIFHLKQLTSKDFRDL